MSTMLKEGPDVAGNDDVIDGHGIDDEDQELFPMRL